MDDAIGAVFGALADPSRRQVLTTLAAHPDSSQSALAAALPITRQAVAKHLGTLAAAGLVTSTRAGRETRYRFTPEPLGNAARWIVDVGGEWDRRLAALKEAPAG